MTSVLHKIVSQSDVDDLICSFKVGNTARYIAANGEERYVHGSCPVEIPLTYPDGAAPEPARPALMLNWNYDSPAKNVYQPEDKAWAYNTVTNTGNVPLKVVIHRKADGVSEYDVDSGVFDPGESVSGIQIGCSSGGLQAWVAPGSGTEELLGVVRLSYYAVGYDPETGEELCRSEPIYRDWKVARPGPVPWPIPSMTNMTAEIRVSPGYESSDPAGYQLGEEWGIHLNTQSTGKEAIPAYAIHVYDPYDGFTDSWYNHDFMPGETIIGTNGGWDLSAITEEDVARGYIYLPPVEFTWTDPESGETMAVKSNELTLMVINRPGLLLEKKLKSVPGSPGYFREGDTLEWELTVANTSKEPVKNVTVADRGETVGTYAEIGPGEQYSVVFSTGPVTDYDVAVGEVKNYFTATSVDLTGGQRTWVSNFATAPTNESSLPVPDPGASRGSGDPRSDPGDPMGTVYGLKVGAQIIKEEAGSPLNGEYYELNETVNFVIRVRNTGEVPLENVSVVDSLGGLAPVGTAAGVAPGEEATFNFSYVVQQSDIDSG